MPVPSLASAGGAGSSLDFSLDTSSTATLGDTSLGFSSPFVVGDGNETAGSAGAGGAAAPNLTTLLLIGGLGLLGLVAVFLTGRR